MAIIRLAIFASGTGSNAQAIISAFAADPGVDVVLIVTNRAEAGVVQVAECAGVECAIISKDDLNDVELMEAVLDAFEVDIIVLAGWLVLVPPYLVQRYANRMLNIHPALLPKFGGKGMWGRHVHEAVKAAGELESGITVHLVNEHYDEGAVIAQHVVAITPEDDAATIEQKVRALELEYYPAAIKKYIESL